MELGAGSRDEHAGGSSSDAEMNSMRKELVEFGLNEEDLSKEEMSDLLNALRCSRTSAAEEELLRSKTNDSSSGSAEGNQKMLRRRYRTAVDRRLPWCLLPPNLPAAQKVKCLSAYIKLLSINQYMRARSLANFEEWAPAVGIAAGGRGGQAGTARATRSGRCVPSYTNLVDDDDEADLFVPRKTRKRKVSTSEPSGSNELGIYSNKTFSLKRKTQKPDCDKSESESKEKQPELTICSIEPAKKVNREVVVAERTSESFCSIIDSVCNSSPGDADSLAKEASRTFKTRQRKT